jgi:type I restriction enzyme S subunit
VPRDPKDEPASKLLERIRAERDKQPDAKKRKKADLPPITEEEIPFEIPQSWEWVRLGDAVELVSGFAFKSSEMKRKGDVQVVKIGNVSIGGYIDSENEFVDFKYLDELANFRVDFGDLLMALTRPVIQNVFKTAVYTNRDPSLLNQRVALVRNSDPLHLYLCWLVKSPYFRDLIVANATGANQPNISTNDIVKFLIPVPPVEEQFRLMDSLKRNLGATQAMLTRVKLATPVFMTFKNSVLTSAFSGRLVPQDPSEGTGHELLEQILASKAKAESTKAAKAPAKKSRSPK